MDIFKRFLRTADHQLLNWQNTVWSIGVATGAIVISLIAYCALSIFAKRSREGAFYSLLAKHEKRPARVLFPLLALLVANPWFRLPPPLLSRLTHAVGLACIACIGWALVEMLDVLRDYISVRHALEGSDNLSARRVRTQVQVLRHVAAVVIVLITVALMVMTFPDVRHLGESLFASAGLAAVVAGLAARTTLYNLLAGVQIALAQPIRLEDVVIVEGEWGWVEEITMTYVVVRIWDLRRLVLPLSYFIEKPFQNWTRHTADLLGTAFIYADYTVPVEEVRAELLRILQTCGMWDGKVWGLQVTNASQNTIELRALMSATSSSAAWDLRCYVREKLIAFLQQSYPESLPRVRAELATLPAASNGSDNNERELLGRGPSREGRSAA